MSNLRKIFIKILGWVAYLSFPSSFTVYLHKIRGVKIGKGTRIHRYVYIDDFCPERIKIGSHVGIGVRAVIIAHDRDFQNENNPDYKNIIIRQNDVLISDYAYIGIGAIILPGTRIGKGAVIGAGAVVNCDIPDHCIAVGVPAKVVKKIGKNKNENLV